jgi:hypothetical protein
VIVHLVAADRHHAPGHRRSAISFIAAGMICVVAGTAVLAFSYANTLETDDIPRLTLSVSSDPDHVELATVKVKFEADGLDPGAFLVADLIALQRGDSDNFGDRIYRAAVGADSSGRVTSDIETDIHRKDYRLIVAQVWPGPLPPPNRIANNAPALTSLCGDIYENDDPRSCAWSEVPL